MDKNIDNNGNINWKAFYAQWDRERLEAELVRNAQRIREMRNEKTLLQSRVWQLEEENREQAAELQRLSIINRVFAETVVGLDARGEAPPVYNGLEVEGNAAAYAVESELEPLRQNSGRFRVSPVEVMYPDPVPSRCFSQGVEAAMLEQERQIARRANQREAPAYRGNQGM